ncbi:pyruvate kinase [Legionella micdadei]|uniref:Pyruvate kinase n=1 Tax=Legionella micdadei TaxID=451 RepID=A0A098GIB0_LEGMI|nr:pyruvate kinase [Legionella micdadei]ARG98635.1 pyruvate kinase [Legionella micdadei]ARH01348.1 pyruvate kinase [Legionella micdadei]KTD28839.1 pyruvate kinase II [Legionella micdadei]NSL17051.1 pyruvate kinase [Legionella micdadei]CEG62218.1 Pyruvate kinase [Legionella micdadei]
MQQRRTKIVATLGPACSEPATLRAMLAAGVDVLRVNFSHINEDTLQLIGKARGIATELDRPLAIIADLQGPKLRIGHFKGNSTKLVDGQSFILDCGSKELGNNQFVSIDYTNLCYELNPGDHLLLDDGLIELEVKSITPPQIHCLVIEGGLLANNKGLNRKGGGLAARALTKKDKKDIETAVALEFDYLTLSFVKEANDILEARQLLQQCGAQDMPIITKIERVEALENLTEIIHATDAVMVARGDLGVEIGAAEVPAIQKRIIEKSRQLDKIVITATQMMESMINHPQPTRAEVSDVANAILDGTDAVMLSAETATGHFPVKVVSMVDRICRSVEKHTSFFYKTDDESCHYQRADQAIAMAAMHTANHFPIKGIIALTESGASAVWMSRHHGIVPIFAVTANPHTVRKLSLVNNVFPILLNYHGNKPNKVNEVVITYLLELSLIEKNSFVLLTRGHRIGHPGGTSCMEIIRV